MKVLVACECSGTVRDAFIAAGHDAMSCDLKPTESPGPHYQGDVRDIMHEYFDLLIAHPDCTYLTISAAWAFKDGPYHQKLKQGTLTGAARRAARDEAIAFVKLLWSLPIARICIENPTGFLSTMWQKPSQIVQPYMFGDDASKGTCLWLKGLPLLQSTKRIAGRIVNGKERWANQTDSGQNKLSPSDSRAAERAVTYRGIAAAMADQWGLSNKSAGNES